MAGGNLVDGAAQLAEATELLERVWAASESQWRDTVRERFEEERLNPLRKNLASTRVAIQQLAEVLTKACRQAADADRSS